MWRAALVVLLAALPAAGAPGRMQGVAIGMWGDRDQSMALSEIAALGADHVSLVVAWSQRDVRSVTLAPSPSTVSDEHLRATLRAARAAGLRVLLFPIVDLEIKGRGAWRGTLAPADVDAWWRSYETFILHYAAIAADEGAELLAVGSELGSTETWRDRWFHLIYSVKKRYRGKLVYSANWDHYRAVSFWERVDYLGATAYNELTTKNDASIAELEAGWRRVRDELVAFAATVGRPLVLTEVGCPSRDGGAVHPWDYTLGTPIDLEEQRRAYAAFVAAWKDELRLAGLFIWEWSGPGGPTDGGYTPRGKPAEKVLRDFYKRETQAPPGP